jgi:long-chain acyl-CoA synthetase
MTQVWEKYYSSAARNFDVANMGPQSLTAFLDHVAHTFGPRPALTTCLPNGSEATISYQQLKDHAENFARYLRDVLGLKQGDVVALMTPNCIGFGVAALGIAKAGCILTNVNPLYTESELQHQLSDSNATVLVVIDLFGDKVDAVLAQTNLRHIVTLSLVEFFSPIKKATLGFALKHIRKVVPNMGTRHARFADALVAGAAIQSTTDIAAYCDGIDPSDTFLIQYTSGTTGRSKGAQLHQTGILANAYQAQLMTSDRKPNGETTLVALPLYHITAFALLFLAGLRTGSHSILVPSLRPLSNIRKALENHDITWFSGINTLFAAIMAEPWFDRKYFAHIRFCGSGGAAQHTGVATQWQDRTGIEIIQGYGMTECHGVLTLNPTKCNKLGKVGIPVPGMEVRLVDDTGEQVDVGNPGEVIFRGPSMMNGYLDHPDANAETIKDGWLYSGDIGVFDKDGFLEIVDRKKDMILVSGFNVSPTEIEDVISNVKGVSQVGVIAIPDAKTAEAPAAFVVRSSPQLTKEDILEACSRQLTNYKRPRKIEFVDEVPTTLSGKVLRRELRDRYLASL